MKTHWLQNPNKNYLGHWDLPDGKDMILTIKSANWEDVTNPVINKTESKRVVRFEEKVKPFICNQINAVSITKSTGVKFMQDSLGFKIQLYVSTIIDNRTKETIDCIRIRKESVVKKELPSLIPSDKTNWDKVVLGLKNGFTIDQVKTRWSLSKAAQESLVMEAAK
jgi:hypothetical protein